MLFNNFRQLNHRQLIVTAFLYTSFVTAASSATAAQLLLPSATAFSILGASCGGIQEQSFASGFDQSGNVVGEVYLQTRCGGSGRGGGYKTHTYSSWVDVTWDLNGVVVADAVTGIPSPDPSIAGAYHSGSLVGGANFPSCNNVTQFDNAFTCVANAILNSSGAYSVQNTLYVVNQASCTATNTSYCTYRAILSPVSAVPVPAPVWLFGSALFSLVCTARRRSETAIKFLI